MRDTLVGALMLSHVIAQTPDQAFKFALGSKTRRISVWGGALTLFLLTLGMRVWSALTQDPLSNVALWAYHASVFAASIGLWLGLAWVWRERQSIRMRLLWSLLVLAILGLAVGRGLIRVLSPEVGIREAALSFGFDHASGVPVSAVVVLITGLLVLIETALAFTFLLLLRNLVLFKRTRSAVSNWHWMLVGMGLAAATMVAENPHEEPALLTGLVLIPVVLIMVVNALRVSWIVYLPFKEKLLALAVIVPLLITLGFATSEGSFIAGSYGFVHQFSLPLQRFNTLAFGFSALYFLSSVLFLFFHLPTTTDFQRRTDERAALQSVGQLIGQVLNRERLASTIVNSPVEGGTADRAWLALLTANAGGFSATVVATRGTTVNEVNRLVDVQALAQRVQQSHQPEVLEVAVGDPRVHARPGDGLESLVVLPITARNDVLGVLFVSRDVTHGFERDDLEALHMFAGQAALALDNARLFDERLEKERLARELDIARSVQARLLPQTLPKVPGAKVFASSASAMEVGGDYYDFLAVDDHRFAFIVADVSGKGTSAAFYMAVMQGIFSSIAPISPSPRSVLTQANNAMRRTMDRGTFTTALYGLLDTRTETVCLGRAGHCPAAVAPLNQTPYLIRSRGVGLGLAPGSRFAGTLEEVDLVLRPGDVLLCYTDGIVESRNQADEEYGYERLLTSLARHRHESVDQIHNGLLSDLRTFLGPCAYGDDLSLLVFKWHGVPSPDSFAAESAFIHPADVHVSAH